LFVTTFQIGLILVLIGIALAGSVAVAVRYLRAIRAARQRIESLGSQVIETTCGPTEYVRVGQGYPVLAVHGALGGFDQGLWLTQGFDLSNYQVISVSRFGYLRSPLPAGASLDLQADALASLLDALHIRQAAVFAVSAGSTSALRFVARHSERVSALILLSPDAPGKVPMAMPPRFIFDTLFGHDFVYWALITFFGKTMREAIGLAPRGYALTPQHEALIRTIQTGDLPVSRRFAGLIFETFTLASEFNASISANSPYPLSGIETPVLVIHAMDDPIAMPENVRGLAEQMPNARLFAASDGGHLLLGHTEEARTEISQFLRSNVTELQEVR
jgi:pimeloyl-ACP methyl ester carboxylesterase